MQSVDVLESAERYGRTYVEVDLDAIKRNVYKMKKKLPEGTKIMEVSNADGYGHSSIPIVHYLEGIDFTHEFAVLQ